MTDLTIHVRKAIDATNFSSGLHPLLKNVYANRGITTDAELDLLMKNLLRPQELAQIEPAVARLQLAIARQQHILVVGDYDADGATGTAVAIRALRLLGAQNVAYKVPDRFIYGYGLTPALVDSIAKPYPDLILTVDNGVSSIAGAARAAELGIDVIVTDHHLPGEQLPDVVALVNPNQPGDTFGSKNLAGVGVVFYLMLALRASQLAEGQYPKAAPNLACLLDIVALGTVADLVSLDYNNRILVNAGLTRIRAGRAAPGILALLNIGGRHHGRAVAADLGFTVGPRLNAAGRLEDMSRGIECLLTDDIGVAKQIAAELDSLNKERRQLQDDMHQQALGILQQLQITEQSKPAGPSGCCLFDPGWHQGVVGLVASKVKDKLHVPVIAFAPEDSTADNGLLKGSARSIKGVHIRDVLAHMDSVQPGLIKTFGGHAMAAGLSLAKNKLAQFEMQFNASLLILSDKAAFTRSIETDGALDARYLNLETATAIRYAGPWGQGFPEPLFNNRFNIISKRVLGGKHLKMVLESSQGELVDAIAFFKTDEDLQGSNQVEIIYRLDVNEFRGQKSLQLMVEHIL